MPDLGALAEAARRLKDVRRKGWVDRGVADAESVADHSFAVALLAWAAARERGLDAERALLIGVVHDLAEAEVGDETPFDALLAAGDFDCARFETAPPGDPARRAAKQDRERAAIERLVAALPNIVGARLAAAWREYDAQATPEAVLVKQIDRVETWLQAQAYQAQQPDLPIGSFRSQVDPDLAALVRE